MPNLPTNDDEDLADDIFEAAVYEAPKPQKKDFSAWHKPRKQFVRHHQWCTEVESLLKDMQPDGNTLKYLGLPGDDLLDLRYFHTQVCEPKKLQLRFLGFNSGASPKSKANIELNISLDEVRKLSTVHPLSEVIPDDFCLIANDSSKAWSKTKAMGPYDIINLDLCDGFGTHKPGRLDNTHYNAVNRLMTLQAKNTRPWLLFLATRTGKQDIHDELLQALIDLYAKNLDTCATFKAVSEEAFAIRDEATLNAAANTPDGHLVIFLAGLCKWIFGLAVRHPSSTVKVKSVLGYRVDKRAAHDDLVSLALRFDPTFIDAADPLGLAKMPAPTPSECDLSTKALKRLQKRRCVDDILSADAILLSEMVAATKTLLALARYDPDDYQIYLQTV